MRVLLVNPSGLMYSRIFLRLEPLGLELVAEAVRRAGHDVVLLDLQTHEHGDYFRLLESWKPEAVGFSLNYLANVPEVIDLAKATRLRLPGCLVFVGGHSASFTVREILEHAGGAIDCVVRGEGEDTAPRLLEAAAEDRAGLHALAGVSTRAGDGPAPALRAGLDDLSPARELLARRRRYFIGVLDPCASVEFTRGCPWDCAFCSGWTFYGRSYRKVSPERAAEDLASVREPGVFIVDDVAFVDADHGYAIGELVERRGIRKQYYLETRADVLLRNQEIFRYWKRLGLRYMFVGLEAIDDADLRAFRKRTTLAKSLEALQVARSIGLTVAVNVIADPSWDEQRFAAVREWATSVPEIVHLTVATPYPGTETWHTEARGLTTRDYRLFDVQHAVLPTRMPLARFYEELVRTQQVLNRKHLGWAALRATLGIAARHLAHGQTNFVRMLWKFDRVYDPALLLRDHGRACPYAMGLPPHAPTSKIAPEQLYVHRPAAPDGRTPDHGRPHAP
ncbi:hopanoid C-3 methylase HpnR [Anaeromyxobacter oryzae]|uniref:B12-binding domain-containing radical SAM protein n=1 Tax=Anaeromyxobacter oryzae TaxID=2918170 RepID=A0ABM7WWD4_9BACT|nr:hopanoid C-3 methylase HpnR [Anaeromyxobacter oryzae]BDG03825.1 B12-binding domain-containing radical SAM protein [Anaeromyxobacter oryzae]